MFLLQIQVCNAIHHITAWFGQLFDQDFLKFPIGKILLEQTPPPKKKQKKQKKKNRETAPLLTIKSSPILFSQ